MALFALAAILFLCGLCSTVLYVIVPFTDKSVTRLETSTILGAAGGFGFFGSLMLAWQGLKKDSAAPARIFPPALAFALAFLGAIFLGSGALAFQSVAPYAFPPFHFLAATLLALTFIAYAARRLGAISGMRALVAYFTWGAMGATLLAAMAEVITAALLVLIAAIALSFTPDGRGLLDQFSGPLGSMPSAATSRATDQLLANPVVMTGILFYFAVIIPPVEEAFKTLALAFMDPARIRLADAVLWAMTAGAGFAAIENLFNGAAFLSAWALGMVLRVGATGMHVANGALMGRGWYAARAERKWERLGLAYAVSVLFHALWNGAVILLSQRAAAFDSRSGMAIENLLAQGVLVIALIGVIVILSALGMVWIAYAVRNAQRNSMAS